MKNKNKFLYFLIFFFTAVFSLAIYINYGNCLTLVSDLITNSAPGASVNHRISFTVPEDVPASGRIVITPQSGVFNIPGGMDYTDIDLSVNGTDWDLAQNPDNSNNGVSIISGNSGNISIILNSSQGINSGDQAIVEVGSNASYQTAGSVQIRNPSSSGSYRINIGIYDDALSLINRADAMIAVVENVSVGSVIEESDDDGGGDDDEGGGGGGGGGTVAIPDEEPVLRGFEPNSGLTLTKRHDDGSVIKIYFPPNTFEERFTAKINVFPKNSIISFYPVPEGLKTAINWIDSCTIKNLEGKSITEFLKPITITYSYTELQSKAVEEDTIKIYKKKSITNDWIFLTEYQLDEEKNTIITQVEDLTLFTIMGVPVEVEDKWWCPADLNLDGFVDLIDFSILMYDWNKSKPNNPRSDINKDVTVDLIDFSIMMYWWGWTAS